MGVFKESRFRQGSTVKVVSAPTIYKLSGVVGKTGTIMVRPGGLSNKSYLAVRMDDQDKFKTLYYFTPEELEEVE